MSTEQQREHAWLADAPEDEAFNELLQRQEAARRCGVDNEEGRHGDRADTADHG